jgi:hypothetical protein
MKAFKKVNYGKLISLDNALYWGNFKKNIYFFLRAERDKGKVVPTDERNFPFLYM